MAKKPRTPPPPRPVQAPQRRDAPKKPGARPGWNRRWTPWAVAAIVIIGLAVGLGVAFSGGGSNSGGSSGAVRVDWSTLPELQKGPPPWGPDWQALPDRLQQLGLSQLSAEGTVLHVHQHLDLWVNGTKVTLPPLVGIYDNTFITELHVHLGEPNIIHVESPVQKAFYLGQVFGEWGVRLTGKCVGSFCGNLHWWLDGKPQTGDPALLRLADHQEIAIALGKPPARVPSSFPFARYGL